MPNGSNDFSRTPPKIFSFPLLSHINYRKWLLKTLRVFRLKVFAELFSKSDRIPFSNTLHSAYFIIPFQKNH